MPRDVGTANNSHNKQHHKFISQSELEKKNI